ncbi:WS/DGAT domain-containing protein [Halopseudomonas pachastrellae]|nr:WS/DGAT domain-containing protein [Halopseudomonas pachastrellae]
MPGAAADQHAYHQCAGHSRPAAALFAGAKIVNVFPIAPVCDGMGVSHCLTGIYDDLNLGVLADRKLMPDMDQYIACMAASTDEYRALLAELEKAAAAEPVALETRKQAMDASAGDPAGAGTPAAGSPGAGLPAAQPEKSRQAGRRHKTSSRSAEGPAAASAKPAGAA